jgi:hypothetical protein
LVSREGRRAVEMIVKEKVSKCSAISIVFDRKIEGRKAILDVTQGI